MAVMTLEMLAMRKRSCVVTRSTGSSGVRVPNAGGVDETPIDGDGDGRGPIAAAGELTGDELVEARPRGGGDHAAPGGSDARSSSSGGSVVDDVLGRRSVVDVGRRGCDGARRRRGGACVVAAEVAPAATAGTASTRAECHADEQTDADHVDDHARRRRPNGGMPRRSRYARRRTCCPSSSMEEQRTFNPLVQGSSPWGGTR